MSTWSSALNFSTTSRCLNCNKKVYDETYEFCCFECEQEFKQKDGNSSK